MAQHIFCPSCGYPNDPQRGACALCYAILRPGSGGSACPSCGADNPKGASFCAGCQTALTAGVRPAMLPDVSGLVGAAAAHGAAAPAQGHAAAGHEDYLEFGDHAPEGDYLEHEAAAPPPPPPAPAPAATFSPPPPPPASSVAAPPPPPPGAFTLDDEPSAPPPPPGAVSLDFDETGSPPPPPPASAPAAEPKKAEDDLADWSLDYDDT
jgi:hypothetical protein